MNPADNAVLLSIEGAVATITLNRPAALNAITVKMLDALDSALADLHSRSDTVVVVITGAGRDAPERAQEA